MNIDNRVPCETTLALIRELRELVQPALHKVAEDLNLAVAPEPGSNGERIRQAKEKLTATTILLEQLLAAYDHPTTGNLAEPTAPINPVHPPTKENILFAPHARRHRRQYLKILLVEDNPVSNAITKAMLEQQGWRVSGVLSGQEALEKLKLKSAYDLILTDLMMHGMNGLKLAQEIRKLEQEDKTALAHTREGRPAVPIIALTASENPTAHHDILAAGIDDTVIKSTSFDSLIASIEKQIDKPAPGRPSPPR